MFSYLLFLAAILMLNRRAYLFLAPVFIGISWRFAQVTSIRNFTIDELLIMVSVVKIVQYVIIRRFEYRMPVLRWYLIYLLGVGFTFLIGLLLFQSYDEETFNDIVLVSFKQRLYQPIVFAAVFVLVQSREEAMKVLRWTAALSVPLAIYGIIQYHNYIIPRVGDFGSFWLYSWFDENEFWRVFSYRRAFGTFGHPAPFGRYMMFAVILAIAQGIHGLENKGPWRIGLAIALAAFYALGISGSRGPLVGLAIALLIIIYLERRSMSRNLIIVMLIIIAFTVAIPEVMSERMGTAIEEGAEEMNVAARFDMWTGLLNDVVSDNIISGYGPSLAGTCFDNDYVGILYEGGVLLLFLFGLWIFSIYQLGMAGSQLESRQAQMCGIIVLGSLVAMLGAGFSGRSFFNPKVGMQFGLIIALCAKVIVLEIRLNMRKRLVSRAMEVQPQ